MHVVVEHERQEAVETSILETSSGGSSRASQHHVVVSNFDLKNRAAG
jgi:hypothetical protein